jgi:hypothetical protein
MASRDGLHEFAALLGCGGDRVDLAGMPTLEIGPVADPTITGVKP